MRILIRVAAGIAFAVLLVYLADAVWVKLRMANHQDPTSSVKVRVMLAVPQKSGRIEFIPNGAENQPCLRSWFPHFGLQPCWYVERHKRKQVDY